MDVQTKQIRHFLIGAGVFLSLGGGIRLYRVIRTHTEDHFFAPHLLLASLSLYIAWKVLKIGMENKERTRKEAISLIRSGSILMMLWGYRLFLLLTSKTPAGHVAPAGVVSLAEGIRLAPVLATLYVLMGTAVMCVGLGLNRSLPKIQNGN